MKKKLALWALWMGCVVSVAACGRIKETDSQPGVQEITFQKGDSSEKETSRATSSGKGETLAQETELPPQAGKTGKGEGGYDKITSKAKVKRFGGTVQIGESGFELYNYVKSSAEKYAAVVNGTAKKLKGQSQVYDMVVPTSVGITLPDNKADKINSSNQQQAIRAIYRKLGKNVTGVELYDILMQHRKEYIYFRTDHHWTQKGAYYAYRAFCDEKGLTAHELSEYSSKRFGSYLGSFYLDTNKSKELRRDKVRAYYPVDNKKIEMIYTTDSGSRIHSPVICDGSRYGISLKYCAFIAGDNPYSVIKNKKKKDGSSCIVVKESFGNAFVPFLADHYQKVYVVDYRYWKGSVTELAKKEKVQDVIFINNISMTRNSYLLGKMAQVE